MSFTQDAAEMLKFADGIMDLPQTREKRLLFYKLLEEGRLRDASVVVDDLTDFASITLSENIGKAYRSESFNELNNGLKARFLKNELSNTLAIGFGHADRMYQDYIRESLKKGNIFVQPTPGIFDFGNLRGSTENMIVKKILPKNIDPLTVSIKEDVQRFTYSVLRAKVSTAVETSKNLSAKMQVESPLRIRRVYRGGACDFCIAVSGVEYTINEHMKIIKTHNLCRCRFEYFLP